MSWYSHSDHRLIYLLLAVAVVAFVVVVVWS
jgi:hypothetical protein